MYIKKMLYNVLSARNLAIHLKFVLKVNQNADFAVRTTYQKSVIRKII